MTPTRNKRIGVVGIPGKWSTEVLADAIEAKTGFRLVIDITRVCVDFASMDLWFEGQNLCKLDGIAIKKISQTYSPETLERLELLRVAEARGVRCFSNVSSIHGLIDRLSCTIALRNAGISMPETTITERLDDALAAVQCYGKAVLKPLFSTKARGMTVVSADTPVAELTQQLSDFQHRNPLLYIQRKYDLAGKDFGVVFLGGEYLCTYSRVGAKGTWNTTINSGGKYQAHTPNSDIIALADRAQAVFGLDYTTVDVAVTSEGPVVFEVSAFGGFRGVTDGAGINAAEHYAEYIFNSLSAHSRNTTL